MPPGLHYLPLDPKAEGFLELFRSFLLSKDERTAILALSEEDAKVFIEIIDRVCFSRTTPSVCSMIWSLNFKAFRALRLDSELKTITFSVLKKLCGRMGHLPSSYLLSRKFDLSGMPHASGDSSDLQKGTFKGKDVAVKSLRISELDDKTRIRKVGNQATVSCPALFTLCTAILQRGCRVEELVPSQRSQPHRGP